VDSEKICKPAWRKHSEVYAICLLDGCISPIDKFHAVIRISRDKNGLHDGLDAPLFQKCCALSSGPNKNNYKSHSHWHVRLDNDALEKELHNRSKYPIIKNHGFYSAFNRWRPLISAAVLIVMTIIALKHIFSEMLFFSSSVLLLFLLIMTLPSLTENRLWQVFITMSLLILFDYLKTAVTYTEISESYPYMVMIYVVLCLFFIIIFNKPREQLKKDYQREVRGFDSVHENVVFLTHRFFLRVIFFIVICAIMVFAPMLLRFGTQMPELSAPASIGSFSIYHHETHGSVITKQGRVNYIFFLAYRHSDASITSTNPIQELRFPTLGSVSVFKFTAEQEDSVNSLIAEYISQAERDKARFSGDDLPGKEYLPEDDPFEAMEGVFTGRSDMTVRCGDYIYYIVYNSNSAFSQEELDSFADAFAC
jgi:hypothetical protein